MTMLKKIENDAERAIYVANLNRLSPLSESYMEVLDAIAEYDDKHGGKGKK